MSQLNKWMVGGKISKLVIVITSKDTGEHVERWQFDVRILDSPQFIYVLKTAGAIIQQTGKERLRTASHR